jgi:hypothetical protein
MTGKHAARRCGEGEIATFDYDLPAELFMVKRKGRTRQRVGYRRFATKAEAIRFAGEDFLLSVRSARGCRSETSASAAMTTLCSAERANAKRRTAITAASHASRPSSMYALGNSVEIGVTFPMRTAATPTRTIQRRLAWLVALAKRSFDLQVDRRLFPAITLDLVLDRLSFVQRVKAGPLNG